MPSLEKKVRQRKGLARTPREASDQIPVFGVAEEKAEAEVAPREAHDFVFAKPFRFLCLCLPSSGLLFVLLL